MMRRNGFTLFEVVVSLGLSVALMTMVGFAMQFYAQQLNTRDSEARRTQLARSVLRMITEDLQACIYVQEFDSSELATVLSSASGGEASAGGGGATGADDADLGDVESSDASDTSSDMESTDLSDSLITTLRPGLIGNQYQIQFDISRLPRLEEYLPMLANPNEQGIEDIPSDVKTVSYYVQQKGMTGVGDSIEKLKGGGFDNTNGGGLVRRALSREVTSFATESGDIVRLTQTGDIVAPEVIQVEFAYFDGTQWIYEWNSDEYEALPLAIQIRLTMKNGSVDPNSPDGILGASATGIIPGTDVYDLIVRLPMAVPIVDEETEEDMSAAGI